MRSEPDTDQFRSGLLLFCFFMCLGNINFFLQFEVLLETGGHFKHRVHLLPVLFSLPQIELVHPLGLSILTVGANQLAACSQAVYPQSAFLFLQKRLNINKIYFRTFNTAAACESGGHLLSVSLSLSLKKLKQ